MPRTATAERVDREALLESVLRITITAWGPIATGGFPPEVADKP